MKNIFIILMILSGMVFVASCSNEGAPQYEPTPLNLDIPSLFEQNIIAPVIPNDNPMTVEGVALGKKIVFRYCSLWRQYTILCDLPRPSERFYG